jgi:hypothetical protein
MQATESWFGKPRLMLLAALAAGKASAAVALPLS